MSADDLYDTRAVDGNWTPVPNEMVEGLARVQLRPHESRVIACILRKTFGFQAEGHSTNIRKARDRISLSQFERATGLDRRRVHESLSRLAKRHIISVRAGKDRQPKSYGINRDVAQWNLSSPPRTDRKTRGRFKFVLNGADRLSGASRTAVSSAGRTALSSPFAHTKEFSETNFKEVFKEEPAPAAGFLKKKVREASPEPGTPQYEERMRERKKLLAEQKKTICHAPAQNPQEGLQS